jgi:integrase
MAGYRLNVNKTMQSMRQRTFNKPLTEDQCRQLLGAAEGEMKGFILVLTTTGQRIRDILALKRGDVDPVKSMIRFRVSRTGIPLETPLDLYVRNWSDQQPESTIPVDLDTPLFPQLSARGARRVAAHLRKLGERAGVPVTARSLRSR